VHGRKAYPFNRFHAPLGHTKPCLPREEDPLGPILYAYDGDDDAPWNSPDSRAAFFERLANIERSHEVDWAWGESLPPPPEDVRPVQRPVRHSTAFLSRTVTMFPRRAHIE
jgi:hypothetical protein